MKEVLFRARALFTVQVVLIVLGLLIGGLQPAGLQAQTLAYDHSLPALATTTIATYWNATTPADSQVVGFLYPADNSRPDNYVKEISVFVGTVGLNGALNGGNLAQVREWKVFMFPQGERELMRNGFSIANMIANPTYPHVEFRHPNNTDWETSIGTHRSGLRIYKLSFSVWDQHWQMTPGVNYIVGAIPVFKGTRPFSVQQFLSSGVDAIFHTASVGVGRAVSMMHNKALADAGLPGLFLSDPRLCELSMCPGDIFLMGQLVDQAYSGTPPTAAPGLNLTIQVVTNTQPMQIRLTSTPTVIGHSYRIDASRDLNAWTLLPEVIAGTGEPIVRTYPITEAYQFYYMVTDGRHPYPAAP